MAPIPLLDNLPFTLAALPYGVISTPDNESPRCAVAIGEHAVDLAKYAGEGRLRGLEGDVEFEEVFAQPSLNAFAALDWSTRRAVRTRLQSDLRAGKVPANCVVELKTTTQHLPMKVGGFSDFYTSLEHCQNCSGQMAAAKIPKNWFYAPSVYNSRTSSLLPTPATIKRPTNVSFSAGIDSTPIYGPSARLDFELEMGFYVSRPVPHSCTLPIASAKDHIFGFSLLNDWSARDHQLFEMRPLGPFHSKGFGTSVSNWIVPMEALEPFSCEPKNVQDPPPFPHLTWPGAKSDGALDVKLRVSLVRDGEKTELATSNLKYMYWTPYQQIAHHAASGCGLLTGDLIGTGTISGDGVNEEGRKKELGCLYEAEMTGTEVMPQRVKQSGYVKGYLEDGDEVVMEGWCEDERGEVVFGFGECRGRIEGPK